MNLELYDGVEAGPVRRMVIDGQEYFERTTAHASDIYCYSVYLQLRTGGVECVADCPDEKSVTLVATALEQLLKGEANESK
jgi:hypothetical protein